MQLTKEQQTIIDFFKSDSNENVRIMAYAGSGKTFVLKQIAEALKNKRGCYLAFNKALADEAKDLFPGNIKCSTVHSLAYSDMRPRLAESPKVFVNLLPSVIENMPKKFSWAVYYTIQNFCKSMDDEINYDHVLSEFNVERYGEKLDDMAEDIITYADAFWKSYTENNGIIPVCHEHYLKLFSFRKNNRLKGLDFLLFDEAQDANPVMIKIINDLIGVRKIVVGDSFQQIYEFTGAVDSLAVFSDYKTFFLSQSFRWGNDVGELSTNILHPILNGCPDVRGSEDKKTSVDFGCSVGGDVDAILCRNNKSVVEIGMDLDNEGHRVSIPGAKELIRQLETLNNFRKGDSESYAGFFTWDSLITSLQKDASLIPNAWMAKAILDGDYTVIHKFLTRCSQNTSGIHITTGHKAKGLEWDKVIVNEDFLPTPDESEIRLFYVACTRARKHLYIVNNKTEVYEKMQSGYTLSDSVKRYFDML